MQFQTSAILKNEKIEIIKFQNVPQIFSKYTLFCDCIHTTHFTVSAATTQMAGRSCCGRSCFSVLEFWIQLYYLVYMSCAVHLMYAQFWFMPDLSGCNYCVIVGMCEDNIKIDLK